MVSDKLYEAMEVIFLEPRPVFQGPPPAIPAEGPDLGIVLLGSDEELDGDWGGMVQATWDW